MSEPGDDHLFLVGGTFEALRTDLTTTVTMRITARRSALP